MNPILSDHARKRMMKRKIRPEWIEITLTHPARTENDPVDSALAHALRPIPAPIAKATDGHSIDSTVLMIFLRQGQKPRWASRR